MGERTGVVFDLDDTLYRELRFSLSGYAAVAQAIGIETGIPSVVLYRFLVRRFRRLGREGLLQALCAAFALSPHEVPRLVEIIRTHRPRLRLPLLSREVLAVLRARGHRLAVLTNGLPSTQRGKVRALGLDDLVDVVVYAQEHAPAGKPAPVCFATVLGRLDVAAAAAVFVGDHPEKDVAGAAAAGLHPIWIRGRRAGAVPPRAEAVAGSLAEVPTFVARLLEVHHGAPC